MHDQNLPYEVGGSALAGLPLADSMRDTVSVTAGLGWLAMPSAVLLARTLARGLAQRRMRAGAFDPGPLLRRLRFHAVAHGAVWGMAGLMLYPAGDSPHQTFLAQVLIGMSAGCMAVTTLDLSAGPIFNGLALAPVIARLLADGSGTPRAMGAMGVPFLAVITVIDRHTWLQARENFAPHDTGARRTEILRRSEMHLAVAVRDTGGRIARLNAQAESLTGSTEADALGRPAGQVLRIIVEETRRSARVPETAGRRAGGAGRQAPTAPPRPPSPT